MNSEKQRILLDRGEELFSAQGYRNVSVENITRSLGMATGTFYSYFKSKEVFYSAILDRIERKGKKNASRIVRQYRSPMNKLKALYRLLTLGIMKSTILRGVMTEDRRYLYPGWSERQKKETSLRNYVENLISEIIHEGSQKRIFRAGLYHNPKHMLVGLYDTILRNLDSENIEDLMDDVLLLLERGFKRRLRLRKRDERSDKRAFKKESTTHGD